MWYVNTTLSDILNTFPSSFILTMWYVNILDEYKLSCTSDVLY